MSICFWKSKTGKYRQFYRVHCNFFPAYWETDWAFKGAIIPPSHLHILRTCLTVSTQWRTVKSTWCNIHNVTVHYVSLSLDPKLMIVPPHHRPSDFFFFFGKSYSQEKKLCMSVVRWPMNMKVYFVSRLFHAQLKRLRDAWGWWPLHRPQRPSYPSSRTHHGSHNLRELSTQVWAVSSRDHRGKDKRPLSVTLHRSKCCLSHPCCSCQEEGVLSKGLKSKVRYKPKLPPRQENSAEEMEMHLLLFFHG